MTPAEQAGVPANRFRRRAKVSEDQLLLLVRNFCHGLSVPLTARMTGLSEKTIRQLFLGLRARLPKPRFARWHRAERALLTVSSADVERRVRDAFFETLSGCWSNTSCWRNWTAGNRQSRLCRSCPLPERLTTQDKVDEATAFIDAVRGFCGRLHIGAERTGDRATLFRLRAIHTATITTVVQNTRRDDLGLLDPRDDSFLSFRSLFDQLVLDLDEEPL